MGLVISRRVREKLSMKAPPVTEKEIIECFANRHASFLIDQREEHFSEPRTHWFIAETDQGRLLKVVFIPKDSGKTIEIRTAYDPNKTEISIYSRCAKPLPHED